MKIGVEWFEVKMGRYTRTRTRDSASSQLPFVVTQAPKAGDIPFLESDRTW